MAINIQEILHPSDSDVIKFEKINYNFDQIVAAGGGPVGPKGPQGEPGTPGFTGAKGEQGVKGEQGLTGATTSPWQVIAIDSDAGQPLSDGVNDYVILKPKQGTDNLRPIIFLGDETFDDENFVDGNLNLRSTLTIGRHATGVNNASDEYLTFWHGTNTLTNEQVAITLSSSEETDTVENWTRFSLDKTYNSSNTNEVELRINLDKIKLEGHVTIGVAGSLLLNNTDLGAVMPTAGMIRYNSNSKTFQGAVLQSDNTTVQWIDFCMSPCGSGGSTGTISIDPGNDLFLYSNGAEGDISINPDNDLELNNTGDPWGGNTTIATTTPTDATSATTTPTDATSATTTPTDATSATTTPTNATSATTLATAATTLAREYTQFLATPSAVNEGSGQITITMNGNHVPNGTQVYVSISGSGITSGDFTQTLTSGSGSGSPYGGSGAGYATGFLLTFNNNTATYALNATADLTTEGLETVTFTAYPTDSAGYSTGSLSDSVNINDTSRMYTASFLGGSSEYGACTNPSFGLWTAEYDGTTSDLITQMAVGNTGNYVYAEVQSDDGPNAINHVGYVFLIGNTSVAGVPCSGVTTTTEYDSGGGTGCQTYNLYNGSNYTVSGSLSGVPDCNGSGNVNVFMGGYQSTTICTSATAAEINAGLGALGAYSVSVSSTGSTC